MSEPLVISNADAGEETGGVSIPAHWRWPALLMVCLIVATIGFFWQTAWLVGNTWYSSRTFSHGFLVLPLAVYLVWIRRHRIVASRPKPNYWGLPFLAILAFAWLLANLGDVRIVQQFALVSILVVTVWLVLGSVVTRALWFPLAFLFFSVPFGESLISPLQDLTARVAVTGLRLSNVPVILEHRTISVPSGPWVVAEACSGIRYLISSFVLGLIYASLVYKSRRRRILFVLASIGVPILANGIRAYGIILLAYLTDNRLAVGVDHIVYGWIFFTGLQLLLFGLRLKWRETTHVATESKSSSGANVAAGREEHSPSSVSTAAISALILIAAAPLVSARLWSRRPLLMPFDSQLWRSVRPGTPFPLTI